jgi:leucyl-tRNA synthetase
MVTKDGSAMSKSRGNAVDPDEMLAHYGADALRLFILFASPPDKEFAWNEDGVEGCFRFLNRVWQLFQENKGLWAEAAPLRGSAPPADADSRVAAVRKKMHQTIKKVGEDIGLRYHLNTAISSIMEFANQLKREKDGLRTSVQGRGLLKQALETIVLLLGPFAPHLCEELGQAMGRSTFLFRSAWPEYDPALTREESVTIVVQVNGKVRDRFDVPLDTPDDLLKEEALRLPRIQELIGGRAVKQVVCVKNKLVSIVV